MSFQVFLLVTTSASIHVFWNLLVKQSEEKVSFAWLTALVGVLILTPLFILLRLVHPGTLTWAIAGWAVLSGFFEALYVFFLFGSYREADLSVVYPLSRGTAPIITLLLGAMLVGDNVSGLNLLWIGMVVAGVISVSYSIKRQALQSWRQRDVLLPLATGTMIAAYHLVDRKAMSLIDPPSPIEYLCLMHLFQTIFISAWVAVYYRHRSGLLKEWNLNRRGVLLVGFCTPLAYFLIMLALQVGNVTFVAAGRNIGIAISTLVGGLILKEKVGPFRILGVALIVTGVAALVWLD